MSFREIKGQDRPISILQKYIKQSRLTGSYLFTGGEGVGKRLTAKTLAKALNCEKQETDSCDACASCRKIEKGQHPDIHIIGSTQDGDSDAIKIEYIRRMQRDISLKPYEGKKKVFIIDDAHNLTPDAANAMLKILEGPPAGSSVILVSAKPALLFKTIISRCKIVKFYPMQRIKLEEVLKSDFHLDDVLAHYLAYSCEGRIGRALNLKDADILREKNRVIDLFTLAKRQGGLNPAVETRNSVRVALNILGGWFRDMYLIKIGVPYGELINLDRKEELLRSMHRYAFTDLYEIMNSISSSIFYLERNANIKLLLSNLREGISYGARRTG
ncbi:MAG: DNA polymerase III subunit [Candidatus Omnitrophota bacterium]